MLNRRTLLRAGAGAAIATTVEGFGSGCGTQQPALDRLPLAGGEPGGTFIKLSRLLARQLVEHDVVRSAPVTLTDGSVENLELLETGEALLAPSLADAVVIRGRSRLRALARVHQVILHCLVRADSPVRDGRDLAGCRVAVGPPGSGTADTAARLLSLLRGNQAGEQLPMSPADGAINLAGGAVDAMLWWGGFPAPEIASIAEVTPLRALDLGTLIQPAKGLAQGVYQATRLSGRVYGQDDIVTISVACHLICHAELGDDVAARVVDIVSSSGRLLVPQPANGVQYFTPATLYDTSPVALHPSAARRYRELHG